jgi:hypothetical protein
MRGAVQALPKAPGVKDEPHPLLVKLAQIGRDYPTYTGQALGGSDLSHMITWEEMRDLGRELK